MVYLLKIKNEGTVEGAQITKLDGTPVEFEITKKESWATFINVEDNEFRIFTYAVDSSFSGGKFLKLDTNSSRITQLSPEKANELKKEPAQYDGDDDFDVDMDLDIQPTFLKDIEWDPRLFTPIMSGTFFDKFCSTKGGIIPASNTMITGDPGIGKSSNMIDILTGVKRIDPDKKVAYISGEMEPEDFAEFRQYYDGLDEIPILFIGDYLYGDGYPIHQVLKAFLKTGYDLVVFDSLIEIQTIIQEELNLPQKKGEAYMLKLLRQHNKGFNDGKNYTAFLCIQQKNKSGQYVGSKRLEHMTTSFLELLWDTKEKGKRYMVYQKNRKGSVKARLYYDFAKTGGIEYDEKRYNQELELLELFKTQGGDVDQITSMSLTEFEKLFVPAKKDITD